MPAVPSAPIVVSDTYAIVTADLLDEADSDVSNVASAVDEEEVAAPAAPPTFTPITVRKNGGADLGPRGRLNLIEGTNVTLTVTDDAASGEVDVEIAASGGGGAHASSHENLGGDEIDVTGLSGELADPQPPKAHAADHAAAGGDPLDVTTLAGYPGGGTTFLRDDGTFAAPPGGSTPQLIVPFIAEGANAVDTNATAAARFFMGSHRNVQRVDLTNMTEVRFLVNRQAVNGAAGYTLELRYHTAHSTTIGTYSQIGTSAVSVNCVTANTYYETAWIALAAGAKADVYLAIQGSGGDGALDPAHGSIVAHFR